MSAVGPGPQPYRVEGPVMILLTTTAVEVDEELHLKYLTLIRSIALAGSILVKSVAT